eukprot:m.335790 g.335790  ORF g.335790 m.335790 type:complete len:213 (+) comp17675_c0_seq1:194-832(+)
MASVWSADAIVGKPISPATTEEYEGEGEVCLVDNHKLCMDCDCVLRRLSNITVDSKSDVTFDSRANNNVEVNNKSDKNKMAVECNACGDCEDVCEYFNCEPCTMLRERIAGRNCKQGKRVFTMCQVQRHNKSDDCWFVANKLVYDVTEYVASGSHPGGINAIIRHGGEEVDTHFKFHPKAARKLWGKYVIGKVVPCPKFQKKKGRGRWVIDW